MRFGRTGAANGVYIIYVFYPQYDGGDERELKITDDDWGYLPDPKSEMELQFSIAKISDSINELGSENKLKLSEVVQHPVEIVRAVKTPMNTVTCATVAESPHADVFPEVNDPGNFDLTRDGGGQQATVPFMRIRGPSKRHTHWLILWNPTTDECLETSAV